MNKQAYEKMMESEHRLYDSLVGHNRPKDLLPERAITRFPIRSQMAFVVTAGIMKRLNQIGYSFNDTKVVDVCQKLHPIIVAFKRKHSGGYSDGEGYKNYLMFQKHIGTYVDGFIVKDGKVMAHEMNGKTMSLLMMISLSQYILNYELEGDDEACADLGEFNKLIKEMWELVPEFEKLDKIIAPRN